jgi:drug/metabolite transporter (DMT)-like permease
LKSIKFLNKQFSFGAALKTIYRAHIALLGTSLIFGANYWISKGLMPYYLDPMQLVVIRTFITFLLVWMLTLLIPSEKIPRKDMIRLAIAGFFGTTVNQVFFFTGLNLSTPIDISIIHVSNPAFVILFAGLAIKEKITGRKIGGVLLGGSGALLLILYGKKINLSSDHFLGNVFAVINMLGYAIYLVLAKPLMKTYHPFTVMKWVFLVGLITIIPVSVPNILQISFENFERITWISLFYVVVANTFLAYLLTIYALKHVEAGVASYYIYLQPIIVAIIALWLGVQSLTMDKFVAAGLIFSGVYLVSTKKVRRNAKPDPHD